MTVSVDSVPVLTCKELADLGARGFWWHWNIDTRDLQVGVGGWWPILLHVVEPGRGDTLLDAKGRA